MTQIQYLTAVEQEIINLNKEIDQKILRGQSYARDAKRHKMLLDQMRKLRRKKLARFISKILSPFFVLSYR